MGIRTNTVLQIEVGQNNSLDDSMFERSFTELLDTLDHATSQVLTLDASTTDQPVPFGPVTLAKLIYIESDLEIEVSFGGGTATSASVTGVGGVYPTLFSGGETLLLEVDGGGLITVIFDVADQSLAQVINRTNSFSVLNGQGVIAFDAAGELRLTSPTTGTSSEVDIQGGTGAATLGLTVAVTNGVNANPGTSDLALQRPADVSGTTAAAGIKVYFLSTLTTSSISLTNNSTTTKATVQVLVAGDIAAVVC